MKPIIPKKLIPPPKYKGYSPWTAKTQEQKDLLAQSEANVKMRKDVKQHMMTGGAKHVNEENSQRFKVIKNLPIIIKNKPKEEDSFQGELFKDSMEKEAVVFKGINFRNPSKLVRDYAQTAGEGLINPFSTNISSPPNLILNKKAQVNKEILKISVCDIIKEDMNKLALNPGATAGEMIETLANLMRSKPTSPPITSTTDQNDKDNNSESGNATIGIKAAAEDDREKSLATLADIFSKHETSTDSSFKPKKQLKSSNKIEEFKKIKDFQINAKKKFDGVSSKIPSFHQEVMHKLKSDTPRFVPERIKPAPSGILNHISKHKFPYGLAALGAGAVGTKILFDKINKK